MKVSIIDKNLNTRERIFYLLLKIKNISDIKTYQNAYDYILDVKYFKPDILITDYNLDILNGNLIAEITKKSKPSCKIIFTYSRFNHECIQSLHKSKYDGYINKKISVDEFKNLFTQINIHQKYYANKILKFWEKSNSKNDSICLKETQVQSL